VGNGRELLWALVLLVIFVFLPDGPSMPVYAKILGDAYSLDGHLTKLLKSWVPAKTLFKLCWGPVLTRFYFRERGSGDGTLWATGHEFEVV